MSPQKEDNQVEGLDAIHTDKIKVGGNDTNQYETPAINADLQGESPK